MSMIIEQNTKQNFQSVKIDISNVKEAALIERELVFLLSDSNGTIKEMLNHILNTGGKRVRPLLVLYSGLIFSELTEDLIHAAVSAELIHMASLVHDDIIDKSYLRRNKPTINKKWNNQFAVLCGDYLFSKAFGVLANKRLTKSMDYMVHAIQSMCRGEIQQASEKYDENIYFEKYIERVSNKTAIFLECCCKSGAAVAGSSEMEIRILGEFGLNLGLAFQIIDDILDFSGNSDVMGKPKYEDLTQGNITLPILILLNDSRYGDWIKNIIVKREFSQSIMSEITDVLDKSNAIDRSFDVASSYIEKAKSCLGLLPKSEYTCKLDRFADMLKVREN